MANTDDPGDKTPPKRQVGALAGGGVPPTEITALLHEQMWSVYRDGARTIAELVRRFDINPATASRAIKSGWPARGFAALKDRAMEHDRLRVEAERKAAEDKHKEQIDAWYRAGKQFNRVADNAVGFCIAGLQSVQNLAMGRNAEGQLVLKPLTRWVRKRDVNVVDGKRTVRVYDEEVPLTVEQGIKVQQQLLKSAAMASAFKRLWPLTTDEERAQDGPPSGLAALSVEQLQHIVDTGQLPAGVASEDVFGVVVPGMGGKVKKANN